MLCRLASALRARQRVVATTRTRTPSPWSRRQFAALSPSNSRHDTDTDTTAPAPPPSPAAPVTSGPRSRRGVYCPLHNPTGPRTAHQSITRASRHVSERAAAYIQSLLTPHTHHIVRASPQSHYHLFVQCRSDSAAYSAMQVKTFTREKRGPSGWKYKIDKRTVSEPHLVIVGVGPADLGTDANGDTDNSGDDHVVRMVLQRRDVKPHVKSINVTFRDSSSDISDTHYQRFLPANNNDAVQRILALLPQSVLVQPHELHLELPLLHQQQLRAVSELEALLASHGATVQRQGEDLLCNGQLIKVRSTTMSYETALVHMSKLCCSQSLRQYRRSFVSGDFDHFAVYYRDQHNEPAWILVTASELLANGLMSKDREVVVRSRTVSLRRLESIMSKSGRAFNDWSLLLGQQ